jgi:hypothetical protein
VIVFSYLRRPAEPSLVNHARYAREMGYRHVVADASGAHDNPQMLLLDKYETLLGLLRAAPEGAPVLVLSENAAVLQAAPFDDLMAGRDWLLVRTAEHPAPQTDVQLWRNCELTRRMVAERVRRCKFAGDRIEAEADLFKDLEIREILPIVGDRHLVLPTGYNFDPLWARKPTFAVSIGDIPLPPYKGFPRETWVSPRFRDALVAHINRWRAGETALLDFGPDKTDPAERSTYNPGRPIALVTLHTPEIRAYAAIAERNLRRYCEKAGYTFYVHRQVPAEIGLKGSGNWAKPWLLHGYLPHHEWVVWVDADVLVADDTRRFEPILEGRDWLAADDIGNWTFNSGVLGMRRTERNRAMLEALMREIAAQPDLSDIYVAGGDQTFFIRAMERAGFLNEAPVCDFATVNTPWMMRRADSFLVHYYGMWWDMRALMMAHDDALGPDGATAVG